ncbi:hypothetical protein COV24_02390 [candidate division WWE3 bacterium CG10_big_fil_rev_8_21_14_0_10_32_10]|uniref:Uncharacterized protein n=1 Tax=candidate division WWE3 bacterium CG10_big_fil_rev_8_21_14_0_10_32_10 TaxID=1975090 RepID=A0A2H0RAH0_UNCKA|nr:MAG: hypothetical protein COV24_02390 [candidate division WWE3 bacterium CG10_big_fil_rev_8_21_14_0_10_32_10]
MEKQQKNNRIWNIYKSKKIQSLFWTFIITLANILAFFLIGYIIDVYFESNPYGKLISVLLSIPLTQYFIYKKVKKL